MLFNSKNVKWNGQEYEEFEDVDADDLEVHISGEEDDDQEEEEDYEEDEN